jgi:hypothetical protein
LEGVNKIKQEKIELEPMFKMTMVELFLALKIIQQVQKTQFELELRFETTMVEQLSVSRFVWQV